MTVKQIYNQYLIPPNLQKHMLRVAALSLVLTENWKEDGLDKVERGLTTFDEVLHTTRNN